MAERPSGSHQFSHPSHVSAPGGSSSSVQQQQQQPPPPQQASGQAQQNTPSSFINAVNVCRLGQEMVHDIVIKAQEVFQHLSGKSMQLNMSSQLFLERKNKLEENLSHINVQFRKLHIIHNTIVEISNQVEEPSPQQLLPEIGVEFEPVLPNPGTEYYNSVVEQHREIVEQVRLKNQQLKEIIDHIRTIIWEINTMITMRRT